MRPRHVLLTGSSTRAAAASAARAGYEVTALDAFADLDQHRDVRALSISRDFGLPPAAAAMARAAHALSADAVAYLSPFENHPAAVARLARDRVLWGNGADTLRAVRDPLRVAERLREWGCPVAAVRTSRGASAVRDKGVERWLVKRLASGGGRGIGPWEGTDAISKGHYLQEAIVGTPGSVTFVAAQGRSLPLAVSRQLIGDAAFGATGFRYCGNIIAHPGDQTSGLPAVAYGRAERLAAVVAERFALVGVNGVDFVVRGEDPIPVEINPRWTGALELVDRVIDTPVFALHAAACAEGSMPALPAVVDAGAPARGKAVLYARAALLVPDTSAWLEDDDIHDVPRAGESIGAGDPICTVFAAGDSAATCYAGLVHKAARIYDALAPHARGAAPPWRDERT